MAINPLSYLKRTDKWYVSGGKGLIWAPTHPKFLQTLGFWDEAHFLSYPINHLFSIALLAENCKLINPHILKRIWYPNELVTEYNSDSLQIRERKYLNFRDVLVSDLSIENISPKTQSVKLVAWGWQILKDINAVKYDSQENTLTMNLLLRKRDYVLSVKILFGINGTSKHSISYAVRTTYQQEEEPDFRQSPLFEIICERATHDFDNTIVIPNETPYLDSKVNYGLLQKIDLKPREKKRLLVCWGVSLDEQSVDIQKRMLQKLERLRKASKIDWKKWFEKVPYFDCSDPFIEKIYWYRWYQIKLNLVRIRKGNHPYPCVFEGIGGFRYHILYSTPFINMDLRWLTDAHYAYSNTLGLLHNQNENGSIPWYSGINYKVGTGQGFVTTSAWEIYRIHPNKKWLNKIYPKLKKVQEFWDKYRDPDNDGLYDTVNHWETGQEFNPRYCVFSAHCEFDEFKLETVDASVYAYARMRDLSKMATVLGKYDDALLWNDKAEKTKSAILKLLWSEKDAFFYDIDSITHEKTFVKTPNGFYPFWGRFGQEKHLTIFERHLFNENEFWTPYPLPSLSKDHPWFSSQGIWRDKIRHSCPWNGRTWPANVSHVIDALGYAIEQFKNAEKYKGGFVEFFNRFVRMLFFNNDPRLPNTFEYYNPFTGQPAYFRGIDDYLHSWIIDLIVKYVVGIRPMDEKKLKIAPMPFDIEYFTLKHIKYKNHLIDMAWRKSKFDEYPKGYFVYLDGQLVHFAEENNFEMILDIS